MFSRTRVGRRGRAIIEEKPPHSPRPGCHPYGLTNLGQEPLSDKSQPGMPGRARSARRRRHRETPQVDKCAGAAPVTKMQQRARVPLDGGRATPRCGGARAVGAGHPARRRCRGRCGTGVWSGHAAAGRAGALGALSRGDLEHLPPLAASQERRRALPTHQPARAHLTHQRLVGGKVVPCLPWRCQQAGSPLPRRHRLPADRRQHLPVLPLVTPGHLAVAKDMHPATPGILRAAHVGPGVAKVHFLAK